MHAKCFSSVQFSCSVMSDSLRPHEPQHTRPPDPSPTPGVHSNPCPSSQWCHPTISSSVVPFSSCLQSFPPSLMINSLQGSIAHQAPLSMGVSRQEYWSELPCPPPGNLSDPGIKPTSLMAPALAGKFFTTNATWSCGIFFLILCIICTMCCA